MKRYALFVGIDDYKEIDPLHCAASDANGLRGLFRETLGYDRCACVTNADERAVTRELKTIGRQVAPGDLFLFFFAGHGKQFQKEQFLLFPEADGQLIERGLVQGVPGLLSLSMVEATTQWPGVARAIILDICRSPLHGGRAAGQARFDGEDSLRDFVLARRPKTASAQSPLVILNSCRKDQQAQELRDYGEHGQGLFSAALYETLKDGARQRVTLRIDTGLVDAIGTRMDGLCLQFNKPAGQRPWREGDDVALIGAAAPEPAPPPLPPPPKPETPPPDRTALLQADFVRQLQAGALDRPAGDCCRDTLDRLAKAGAESGLRSRLAGQLQAALDARAPDTPAAVRDAHAGARRAPASRRSVLGLGRGGCHTRCRGGHRQELGRWHRAGASIGACIYSCPGRRRGAGQGSACPGTAGSAGCGCNSAGRGSRRCAGRVTAAGNGKR